MKPKSLFRRSKRLARGVEKPRRRPLSARAWLETRNFLYYDGTEMPQVKEDKDGKRKQ